MGPNLYISPPGGYTFLHLDGSGTVDSGHLCLSGYNEVLLFDRMSENKIDDIVAKYNGTGANNSMKWPKTDDINKSLSR